MSMSMNNRLLQNYLDLSLNSEAKNSDVCSPKMSASEKKKLSKLAKAAASQLAASNQAKVHAITTTATATPIECKTESNEHSTLGDFEFSGKNLLNGGERVSTSGADPKTSSAESIEMNNLEQSTVASNSSSLVVARPHRGQHKPVINGGGGQFNSISGLITGLETNVMHMRAENRPAEHTYNNPSSGSCQPMDSSTYEISRIPSMKRPVYSVSTVATQADMDRGTILAERKDFKYRNQDMSDVESQILSIEVDLCSDAYASIADWCHTTNNNTTINNTNNNNTTTNTLNSIGPKSLPSSNQYQYNQISAGGSIKDRFLSARKELASVTVNDYVAFKNCLNMQLQTGANNTVDTLKPLNLIQDETGIQQAQPIRNRMIVRIASISSAKSSAPRGIDQEKTGQVESAFQDGRAKPIEVTNAESEIERKLSKLILEAYQNALLGGAGARTPQHDSLMHSFPNNLYMYLDSAAHLKTLKETSLPFTSKDCIENLIKLNIKKLNLNVNDPAPNESTSTLVTVPLIPAPMHPPPAPPPLPQTHCPNNTATATLKQSSTLNTILDTNNNESHSSSRLEESFMKCYEVNAKLKETRHMLRLKYAPDPNEIYSHVETSTDESESAAGSNKLSRSDSNSSAASSSTSSTDSSTTSTTTTTSSQTSSTTSTTSSSTVASIEVDATIEATVDSKTITGSYSFEQAIDPNKNAPNLLSKAERLKKMLEEERVILEAARKKNAESTSKFTSFANKVYVDDENGTPEASVVPGTSKQCGDSDAKKAQLPPPPFFHDEDFSEDYNYPNKEILVDDDEDELSSSATGSKNVRFADDVSYI